MALWRFLNFLIPQFVKWDSNPTQYHNLLKYLNLSLSWPRHIDCRTYRILSSLHQAPEVNHFSHMKKIYFIRVAQASPRSCSNVLVSAKCNIQFAGEVDAPEIKPSSLSSSLIFLSHSCMCLLHPQYSPGRNPCWELRTCRILKDSYLIVDNSDNELKMRYWTAKHTKRGTNARIIKKAETQD